MTNASRRLRFAYVNGYEIVVVGELTNPARPDGRHPVIYQPRSPQDKSPWVRADGYPFRYNSGELEAVKPAGWRRPTTPEAAKITGGTTTGRLTLPGKPPVREVYTTNEDVDRHLAGARATGHLDPYWWRMS